MSLANWFREWNDVNVSTAKVVLVAMMQFVALMLIQLMWCVAMIVQLRHWKPGQDVDFHTEFLYLELGALLALSGINLGSRIVNRTTDVDYQLAKNAGKTQNVQTGDNPVNVTTGANASRPPAEPALPQFTRPTRRQSAQMAAVAQSRSDSGSEIVGNAAGAQLDATAIAGPRSMVTDHDRGVI